MHILRCRGTSLEICDNAFIRPVLSRHASAYRNSCRAIVLQNAVPLSLYDTILKRLIMANLLLLLLLLSLPCRPGALQNRVIIFNFNTPACHGRRLMDFSWTHFLRRSGTGRKTCDYAIVWPVLNGHVGACRRPCRAIVPQCSASEFVFIYGALNKCQAIIIDKLQ